MAIGGTPSKQLESIFSDGYRLTIVRRFIAATAGLAALSRPARVGQQRGDDDGDSRVPKVAPREEIGSVRGALVQEFGGSTASR
jgi:hypothetical protein